MRIFSIECQVPFAGMRANNVVKCVILLVEEGRYEIIPRNILKSFDKEITSNGWQCFTVPNSNRLDNYFTPLAVVYKISQCAQLQIPRGFPVILNHFNRLLLH